jgi:hypothetical protein
MSFQHVRATREDFVYSPRNCHNLPIRPAIQGDLSRYQIAVKEDPSAYSTDASAIQTTATKAAMAEAKIAN